MFEPQFHVIDSDVLHEKILLVGSEVNVRNLCDLYPECVVYTHDEVGKLFGLPAETLRAVHDIKKTLSGCVSGVSEPVQ